MVEFTVYGPLAIPYIENERGSKHITIDAVKEFWSELDNNLAKKKGCYVFGLKKRTKVTPYYVGKACKNFLQEIFSSHKLTKFNEALHSHSDSKPVVYLIVHPRQKGKTNESAIDELETYLIQSAVMVNPEIKNINKIGTRKWTIRNVIDVFPGRSRQDEKNFSKTMGLNKTS